MKNQIYIVLIATVLVISACAKKDEKAIPDGLKEKKEMLKTKHSEVRELNKIITELEEKIAAQDPSSLPDDKLVEVSDLLRGNLEHFVEIQGKVVAKDFANASSEIGGRLLSVRGQEGQYVARGSLIGNVDVETINKQIQEIETAMSLAQDTYERQERLWSQKIGSEMQYLQAKNQVDRLKQSKETMQFQLTKANIYAPISGTIDMVMKDAGEIAGPGEPIIRILDTRKLKAEIDVPENYLLSIKKGNKAEINLPAINETFSGRISLIGNSIDPSSRTFKIEVDIPSKSGLVKPNLLATMRLKDEEALDAIIIPVDLIQQEITGKDYLLVADMSGDKVVVQKKYIETGISYDGMIAVSSGLDGSEKVISAGALSVSNGDQVKIVAKETPSNGK